MSILSKIFSVGADSIISSVGKAVDECITSDEERELAKIEMKKVVINELKELNRHAESEAKEVTKRLKIDMNSDSWLSKNIRPLCLSFTIVTTILLSYCVIFVNLTPNQSNLASTVLISLLLPILLLQLGFYFGGRAFEKIMTMKEKNKLEIGLKNINKEK